MQPCVAIYILSRFTHFFRKFFWPKQPSPQHHTFFACMGKPIIGHWSEQEQEQILFVGSKIIAVAALSCDHSKLAGEEQNFVKIDLSSIQACQKKSQNTARNISFSEKFAGLPSGHLFVPLEHHLGSMQTTLGNHFSQNGQNFGTLAEQLNITETNSMVFETTLGQL